MNSTNKIVLGGAAFSIFLAAMFFIASPKQSTQSAQSKNAASATGSAANLSISEDAFYDFGTISMAQGNASHAFKVKNTGAEPVQISKIYTSCMCTSASFLKEGKKYGPYGMPGMSNPGELTTSLNQTISPDEEASVEVVFDPNAHGPAGVGPIDRTVYLETPNGNAEIRIKGMVTP
jgi:hypothetical protein